MEYTKEDRQELKDFIFWLAERFLESMCLLTPLFLVLFASTNIYYGGWGFIATPAGIWWILGGALKVSAMLTPTIWIFRGMWWVVGNGDIAKTPPWEDPYKRHLRAISAKDDGVA
ncbi:MAG TPA: hypothetical protein VFW90_03730 [Candidatus Saccharimonadales bacterium]|nr:hypothetical protein [Candidatus Saccharimonadales bacterium]